MLKPLGSSKRSLNLFQTFCHPSDNPSVFKDKVVQVPQSFEGHHHNLSAWRSEGNRS